MKIEINDPVKRALYEMLKANYPNNDISESYLRQEQIIKEGQQEYKFGFTVDSKSDESTKELPNQYLAKQDTFVAFMVGLFLLSEVQGTEGKGVLQTYPNPIVFPDVSGGFQNSDLEAIYNGQLYTKVGTQDVAQPTDLMRFRQVPSTQQSSGTNGAKNSENVNLGFVPLDSFQIFSGEEQNFAMLKVPTWTGQKMANGLLNRLVLMHRGFIIKGVNKLK